MSTVMCVQNDSWAYGTFGANRAPILHWHLHYLQTDWNKIWHDPRHLGVPSCVSEMIAGPMVHSAQTMHESCVNISTISKRTETSFHLSIVTSVYHRVHPKGLLSLWYIWRKPCTYLVSRLALSPNGTKQASTWASNIGVPSGASKTISEPIVRLAQTVHLSCIKISTISKRASTWAASPRRIVRCVQNDF
jgi:hypothetical protein